MTYAPVLSDEETRNFSKGYNQSDNLELLPRHIRAIEQSVLSALAKQGPIGWRLMLKWPTGWFPTSELFSDYGHAQQRLAFVLKHNTKEARTEPIYAAPMPAVQPVEEKGPWKVGSANGKLWIESDDFTHDVRLYVDGDFAHGQRLTYAIEIARRLNAALPAVQERVPVDPKVIGAAIIEAQRQHLADDEVP